MNKVTSIFKEATKICVEEIENYKFYLDLRRYGSVQHSGYGLGVERLIAWITGITSLKDAIPFPRTVDRWTP